MKSIGKYEIRDQLGEGAMARVYRAFDPQIQRDVAIKVLNEQLRQDANCVERFLREARASGALAHPNIVTIHDVGDDNGVPYIAMELLEGRPLDEVLADETAFDPQTVLELGRQLAEALGYAHANGVIHRDIKPSNMILSRDKRTIKILDFGIARVAGPASETDATRLALTHAGELLGTPRYMSPEQALGQDIDHRSDLFSLGAVLYEMVAGRPAFDGSSVATLALQITGTEPPPIQSTPECPRGLQHIIQKLLAKLPKQRFADAQALADALRRESISIQGAIAEERRGLPLYLKFASAATLVFALVSFAALSIVSGNQSRAMDHVAETSARAVAGFISANAALPMMQNVALPAEEADWLPIEAFAQTVASDPNILALTVVDKTNVIRGSNDPDMVGRSHTYGSEKAAGLDVAEPIIYSGVEVGTVYLTFSAESVTAAESASRWLLIGVGLVTTIVMLALSFAVGKMTFYPLRRLAKAMKGAADGDHDFRISHNRSDEFGELYDDFNNLVGSMQPERTVATKSVAPLTADQQLREAS